MLAIYNESKIPWELIDFGEGRSAFRTTRTFPDKYNERRPVTRTTSIDIRDVANVNIGDISGFVEMELPQILINQQTNILFQKKDGRPIIVTEHKYNKNIMLITIRLNGAIVTGITTKNVFIFHSTIATGELSLIAAIDDRDRPTFNISLHHARDKKNIEYHFGQDSSGEHVMSKDVTDAIDIVDVPGFRIPNFRPARPTHLIITHKNDMDVLKNVLGTSVSNYTIVSISNKQDLESAIDSAVTDNYSAATLFVDLPNIRRGAAPSKYANNLSIMEQNFKVFNVLLNTGKVVKK